MNEEVEVGETGVRATSFLWSLGRRDLLKLAKCRLRIERKNSKRKQKRKKTKSTSLVSNNEFSHFLIFGTQCNGACRLPLDTFKGVGGDVNYDLPPSLSTTPIPPPTDQISSLSSFFFWHISCCLSFCYSKVGRGQGELWQKRR